MSPNVWDCNFALNEIACRDDLLHDDVLCLLIYIPMHHLNLILLITGFLFDSLNLISAIILIPPCHRLRLLPPTARGVIPASELKFFSATPASPCTLLLCNQNDALKQHHSSSSQIVSEWSTHINLLLYLIYLIVNYFLSTIFFHTHLLHLFTYNFLK